MWAAARYGRWGLEASDSWCLGGLGIAVQMPPFSPGNRAAPGAVTHKAGFLSCYLCSSFHHGLLNLELRTLFSSSNEVFLRFSITGSGGIQGAIIKVTVNLHQARAEPPQQTVAFRCRVTIITPLKLHHW